MSAMLVDSETLDLVRELIVAGRYDPAISALDTLTARSPRSEERQATYKQRIFLTGLTSYPWLYWKARLLSLTDAKRMISELLEEGSTTHKRTVYTLTEKAKEKAHKRAKRSEIPF